MDWWKPLVAPTLLEYAPREQAQPAYDESNERVITLTRDGYVRSLGAGGKEAWHQAAAEVRAFRAAYRTALAEWCKGVRDVLFPEGTWWMQVFHTVGTGAQRPAA